MHYSSVISFYPNYAMKSKLRLTGAHTTYISYTQILNH